MIKKSITWLILLLALLLFNPVLPAFASIHKYPERTNQVMYRSTQSLRDRTDLSWQLVLFKRVKNNQVDTLHLRLIGFPGLVELPHRFPLMITAGNGETWTAKDVVDLSLPKNVGEYDLREIIKFLENKTALELLIPLTANQTAKVLIPPFVVREWRKLVDLDEFL